MERKRDLTTNLLRSKPQNPRLLRLSENCPSIPKLQHQDIVLLCSPFTSKHIQRLAFDDVDGSRVDRCGCCYPSSHSLQTLQFQWKKMILACCKRLCHTSRIRQSQVILNLALHNVVHLGRRLLTWECPTTSEIRVASHAHFVQSCFRRKRELNWANKGPPDTEDASAKRRLVTSSKS